YYLPYYLRTDAAGALHRDGTYQLVSLFAEQTGTRLATDSDLESGVTAQPIGMPLPFQLSPEARRRGARLLRREPPRLYRNADLHEFLKRWVYDDAGLLALFRVPLLCGVIAVFLQIPFSVRKDVRRRQQIRYGRRLKGPLLVSGSQFSKALDGDGIGLVIDGENRPLRIPRAAENKHILTVGDTGAGKSTIIRQILFQVAQRGHSAIVYDPACEFIQQFYDEHRGDIVLNPLDTRCPYWSPSDELQRKAEAKAIAVSLFQPSGVTNRFFVESPQKIFAHLLTFLPTPSQLIEWMSHPEEIDQRVKGTELAAIIDPRAPNQRTGVLGSLNMIADSFRLLPKKEETSSTWTATKWAEDRRGWIFITSRPALRDALLPLISLWLDLLVLRLLTEPHPHQRPAWFVIDELASLQRLPQLHTAITENRKSNNPIILGFQGRSQLESRYGHDAEAMLSQPATKIFLRTSEPRAAKWVSEAIGEVEVERLRETHYDGTRRGRNFALDRQTEPLVMPSEISGMDDLRAYLKYGNYVARFSFPYIEMQAKEPPFIEREMEDFLPRSFSPDDVETTDESLSQSCREAEQTVMDFNSEHM
ncbi:MAG TPA: type IV secretion system DNA-binding domain-containing protein, partial [Terriglobales bacterium]|nr:type IV secretion system DNA-binding domain-containing protein [Terriglobales bacterium]